MFHSPLRGREVMLCATLAVSSYLLLGPLVASWGLWGLVLLQLFAFALPSVAIARLHGSLSESIGLRRMSPRAVLGAVLLGLSAWHWILLWIAPLSLSWGDTGELQQLSQQLDIGTSSMPLLLFAMAIVPALCEELFNRGVLFAGLVPRLGTPSAILLSSLFFGLSHLSWIRLLPTAFLGALAALAFAWSGSLWGSVIVHALYNGSLLLVSRSSLEIAPWQAGISFGFSILGLTLLLPREQASESSQR